MKTKYMIWMIKINLMIFEITSDVTYWIVIDN